MTRTLHAWTAALVLLALAGGRSRAQDTPASPGADGLLEVLQLKGKAAPAAPFVQQSRPAQSQPYIPVGKEHPVRPVKVMTPAEVAATEADLDAARERQQRRAGKVPPPVPLKPVSKPKGESTKQ